jgi:GntR family transcriptional regulator
MSTMTDRESDQPIAAGPEIVSRNSALPLHAQISAHFRQLILAGMLPNGNRIPPEGDLALQFQVARGTVRAAMSRLLEEGLIERAQGIGTFVSVRDRVPPDDSGMARVVSTGERLIEQGIEFRNSLLERRLVEERRAFGAFSAHRVMHIRRLRTLFDGPASVTDTLLNLDLIPEAEQLTDDSLASGSLHATLKYRFGVEFTWAERFFSAESSPAEVAHLLSIPPGTPVLCHEEFSYTHANDCVEYSRSWVRTDQHKYAVTMRDPRN